MYKVFCATVLGSERHQRMAQRLDGIQWIPAVSMDDPRMVGRTRPYAIMYAHLDMIRAFLDSDADYGVICEDDVHIRKDFKDSIQTAIREYRERQLDVLLLGYLVPHRLPEGISDYDDSQWGTQMYLLDRESAADIYETFCDPSKVPVFASDWTITKYGKRARIYPMLAIEEGSVDSDHEGQIWFHRQCHDVHFDPEVYN